MNNKRVLFVSKGEHAASTRYRVLAYFNMLQANGWRPAHLAARHNSLSRIKLLYGALRADVVVILRRTFGVAFLRLLRLCSKRIVFDLDDAIFLNSDGTPSRRRENRFAQMARHCQQIWVGNDYLRDAALRYNQAVVTFPTSVSLQRYELEASKPVDHIDLVWIGSSSTRRYLEEALPTLERLAESFVSLRLKIIADFDLPSQSLQTITVPWSEEIETKALASAHIGIAPMPDNPWTRGKCGLKVLQYMAAGLPVVSSPTGVNGSIVEEGVTGFLVNDFNEWYMAVEGLVSAPELRRIMGEAGRNRVIEDYSVDVTCMKMIYALENV